MEVGEGDRVVAGVEVVVEGVIDAEGESVKVSIGLGFADCAEVEKGVDDGTAVGVDVGGEQEIEWERANKLEIC